MYFFFPFSFKLWSWKERWVAEKRLWLCSLHSLSVWESALCSYIKRWEAWEMLLINHKRDDPKKSLLFFAKKKKKQRYWGEEIKARRQSQIRGATVRSSVQYWGFISRLKSKWSCTLFFYFQVVRLNKEHQKWQGSPCLVWYDRLSSAKHVFFNRLHPFDWCTHLSTVITVTALLVVSQITSWSWKEVFG